MYIESFNNNGVPYLRLVENVRIKDSSGNSKTKKKLVKAIGSLSKFDDGQPDYLQRLRESFRNGKPLIDDLLPFVDASKIRKEYKFTFHEGDPICIGETKKFGYVLIERILDELGLVAAVRSYKSASKIEYDIMGLIRLLIYGRILNPQSKIATFNQNLDYYEKIADTDNKYNIYEALDFIFKHKKQFVNRINHHMIDNAGRTNNFIFYDVTNFFFEIDSPDDDFVDDDGCIHKGLRQNGVCKEERKLPIVQMGLFMDENGIPISIETFRGNTLDHQTVQPALSRNIDNVIYSRYIFIGDRGLCNYPNISHLINRNKGYIISKSIKKSSNSEKEWILNNDGYISLNNNFKYKSRIITRIIKGENGKEQKITEKVIVYWSKKFYNREVAENCSFLEFLEKLAKEPENFRISSMNAKKIRKFLKKDFIHSDTGELINSNKLKTMIDIEAIEKYKKFFGYYQIVTSELDMPDLEVIEHYKGLTQIENQFRIMKSDLQTRPIYVRTPEHIEAHLTICLIALIVLRIIQNKIVEYMKNNHLNHSSSNWETGMTGERIQTALNKWNVLNMDERYYMMCNTNDNDLQIILKAFGIEISNKFFTKGELKSLKRNIKIF